jgi:PTS system nitrogen regulatory IIA component
MFPKNFIQPQRIRCQVEAASKKRVLEQVGGLLADAIADLTQDDAFDRLLERERLGSTGLGHGVALPHARSRLASKPYGAFLQLRHPVDYDAIDQKPVDLVFALLVPEAATQEHLQLLATLAGLFGDEEFCRRIRDAGSAEEAFDLITHWDSYRKTA